MKTFLHYLNNIEKYIIYVLFTVLIALMFTQVVARYVFHMAWGWMEIVTRLLFIYVTFAGISWACKGDEHLRVTFLAEFLPGKHSKNILFLIGNIAVIFIAAYMWWLILAMMIQCFKAGQTFSGASFIPIWVMYLAGVLGMGGMCIRTMQYGIIPILKDIKNGSVIARGEN